MLKRLDQTLTVLFRIELFISVTTLAAIIVMNSVNLLSRWIFRHPFDWILEISLILFVYSVMFAVPVLYREKGFIQMHLLEERLSRRGRFVLGLFVECAILAFLVYLLPHALKLSLGQIETLSRGLGLPRIYVTIPVSIAAALCIPVGLSNLAHLVRERGSGEGNAASDG
jgi:TRAP-type C4-dicarboxylate transport system permease small subunit